MRSKFSPKLNTPEMREKILVLQSQGLNPASIARELGGVAAPSIRNFLKRNNITPNIEYGGLSMGYQVSPSKEQYILELYSQGFNNSQISKKTGLSKPTIKKK